MPVTDYHVQIRDAIISVLNAVGGLPTVVAVEDPNADIRRETELPTVIAWCMGEGDAPAFSTNARDGIAYAVGLALVTHGITSGEKDPDSPDATALRRQVRVSFNNQRLTAVTEIGFCETSVMGNLFEKGSVAFQRFRAGMVVNAIGRFPRE